jgi:hypothetical protein
MHRVSGVWGFRETLVGERGGHQNPVLGERLLTKMETVSMAARFFPQKPFKRVFN